MYFIQASIYSKLIDGFSTNPYHAGLLFSAFVIYKMIPSDLNILLLDWYNERNQDNDSCIVISTHKKSFFGGTKEYHRNLFSTRFKGVNHYLIHNRNMRFSHLVETVRHEYDHHTDDSVNYILLPHNKMKFQLCEKQDIWIETIINNSNNSLDEDKILSLTSASSSKSTERTYIYKLTKPGKGHTQILENFIDECVEQYRLSMLEDKSQKIFELVKTQRDESDKVNMIYSETDFKSNKYLDKNMFYPEVKELTEYIDRFPKNDLIINETTKYAMINSSNPTLKSNNLVQSYEDEYERLGVTYKCTILLHGKPGTGKSGTIKGILNRTGRHGILVRWTKLKSCAEFISLFSNIVIKDLKYSLREVCFIFEDFDANSSQILKTRKLESTTDSDSETNKIESVIEDLDGFDLTEDFNTANRSQGSANSTAIGLIKKYRHKLKRLAAMTPMISDAKIGLFNDDELSLECILNTMDGVKELKDAMIIFTTNHLADIDPAFIRPGRIDKIVHLKYTTVAIIKQMVSHRFQIPMDDLETKYGGEFNKMRDDILSPADVQSIAFQYPIAECIAQLLLPMG